MVVFLERGAIFTVHLKSGDEPSTLAGVVLFAGSHCT